ncbi:HlyD family type I secretion periplasmic adaptor subunit [Caulobacter hibisci]|uniref:Membrane fusion protein (MFP) family protein n=1 Tax=Caulobacter hibisci TaxID=2035993 RepID=A0ABS0T556_9CAUL|nr:HlyD family type I secretion periplasmic adaptor subunit [Caulobacter hibisci]MBI1687004.1 HlyD family type I secretion periplasmic adaptor subunit [Caulobacter hibisci]
MALPNRDRGIMEGELLPAPLRAPPEVGLDDSPKRVLLGGLIIAGLFFVVLLGWSAFARLDAAAYGQGQVTVSGNRQTVQHRDGGVIEALDIRDGQHVQRGQVLIRLVAAEVAAQERAYANTVIDLQAQKARLEAEINGTGILWPAEFANLSTEDRSLADRAMMLQQRQLLARRNSLSSSRAVLRQQAQGVQQQTGGLRAQTEAAERQKESLRQQLESTRELEAKGFASRNTVRSLERALAQLEGTSADYSSRVAAAGEQIAESQQQSIQATRRYTEESAGLLRDTQFQLNEALPKLRAAREQLERTIIRAPVAGKVVGLRVFTEGGVIQAGQAIMDIVPDAAPLEIKANFSPTDIDGVYQGREAEVRFQSLHERDLPILLGTIRNVSADSLLDEASGKSYFSAEIVVPESQMRLLRAVRGADTGIRPGVPVQVLIKLRKRTALQYMLDPLTEAFKRSLHER